jgi:hypothetical protein
MSRIPLKPARHLALSLGACQQPISTGDRLRAMVSHQHKLEVILADLHQDCDSSVEATLKYRTDSLVAVLEHPVMAPSNPKGSKKKSTPSRPGHHTHQKTSHHH